MVSDSWKTSQISQKDVLICQGHQGTNMEVQMSITFTLHIIFEAGLIKKQHGSEIPIGTCVLPRTILFQIGLLIN